MESPGLLGLPSLRCRSCSFGHLGLEIQSSMNRLMEMNERNECLHSKPHDPHVLTQLRHGSLPREALKVALQHGLAMFGPPKSTTLNRFKNGSS